MSAVIPRLILRFMVALLLCVPWTLVLSNKASGEWRNMMGQALLLSKQGQYKLSFDVAQSALTEAQVEFGANSHEVIVTLLLLGNLHHTLGDFPLALPLQERALRMSDKTLGPEHPETAAVLNNLAVTHHELAQHDQALPLQVRALGIYEKALGPEHPSTARGMNNLARTYSELGQHEKALPLQVRALAIYEKALGLEHPETALGLNNLALTYSELGQHEKALQLQLRALAILDKALGNEHPQVAFTLNNLAQTYSGSTQHDQALPLQLRAQEILEKNQGPDHPDTALGLNNLALTYKSLAQHDRALQLQVRVLSIYEKVLGPEHPKTAVALIGLAVLIEANERSDVPIGLVKRAVNIYQVNRDQVSRIGKEELRSYTDSVSANYRLLARWLVEQERLAEAEQVLDMLKENEHFDFIRRTAAVDPRRTRAGYTATEQKWMDRYNQIAANLASLGAEERELDKVSKAGLSAEQAKRMKELASDLAISRKAFDQYMKEIQTEFAGKGTSRTAEVAETSVQATNELQQLVRGLGEDVVLLRYYVTDEQVGILMTAPGVHVARSFKIDAKELRRQVNALRSVLRDKKTDPLPPSQSLYKVLIGPIEDQLLQSRAKTVMLSLDGALRYLPFGALHDGRQYIARRWNLPIYTSVMREKLKDEAVREWQAAGLGVTKAWGNFAALPSVRPELNSIVNVGANGGVLPGEVFLDEAFSASSFKEVGMRKFQLMHVASHFQFSPGTESNSFLLLGDGKHLTLADIRTQNYRFDNVDLLTLAACDTGLGGGRNAQGKEIEGFGVIAQQQGAKAVLATLWPVADQSTSALMADMYRRRQAHGLTKIEALRQAQMALMQQPKYAHPFYWAPFILMGNWR